MSAYLIVDVDDFLTQGHNRALSVDFPDLATKLLTGAAFAVGLADPNKVKAIAIGNWPQHHRADGQLLQTFFEASGFNICQIDQPDQTVNVLYERYFEHDREPVDELILVTSSCELLRLAACVPLKPTARVRVWADQQPDAVGLTFQSLASILKIQAETVALYIDFEAVTASLNDLGYSLNLDRMIMGMTAHAAAQGQVIRVVAYAPWGQRGCLPPLIDDAGHEVSDEGPSRMLLANIEPIFNPLSDNPADSRLARDILVDSLRPSRADVIIIASGNRDFSDVIPILRDRHQRVIVWSVRGSAGDNSSVQVDYLDEFLDLQPLETLRDLPGVVPGNTNDCFLPSQWSSLVLQYDRLAATMSGDALPVDGLIDHLRRVKMVVSEARARDLISQGITIGVLCTAQQGDTLLVHLNSDHRIVKLSRLIRDRIMLRVSTTLDMRGWSYVNRGFLLRGLAMDPKLNRPGLNIDDEWRAAWVDCMVREGILLREVAPRHAESTANVMRMSASR